MNELKELLEHIDAPTRAAVMRHVKQQEKEIEHLQEQYRQLQELSPLPEPDSISKLVTRAKSDIGTAVKRAGSCTVFYDAVIQRFKVVTQDARIAVETRRSDLVGAYRDGYSKERLTEDLYDALESSGIVTASQHQRSKWLATQ